jgi:hypothetical protein
MPALTLHGRLLCACNTALEIASDGTLDLAPADIYYAGAGFVDAPKPFVGGNEATDACLVGTVPDGVVLAFRGTLSFDFHSRPSLLDWLNDFNADPADHTADGFPGAVHPGFYGSTFNVLNQAVQEVKSRRVGVLANVPLLVTGYSKGGAMAALAAWQLQAVLQIPVQVVCFEGPKPGDAVFRDAYNAQIDHTRYEYADDIVPLVPPGEGVLSTLLANTDLARFDYEPVGVLRYITESGDIQDDSPAVTLARAVSLGEKVVLHQYLEIVQDHSIACGSGCMRALCPTDVCPA